MALALSLAVAFSTSVAAAEDVFELAPIRYSASTPDNPVSRLQARLAAGESTLTWDDSAGWLSSVLAALEVPTSSQTLVFSKTSLQQTRISPRNPRALYFNDDVYVGYVRTGEVVEVSVADPALGTVFYSMEQVPGERRRFERRTEDCLLCHGGSQTRGVPGHIVRSVYPSPSGQPIFSAGSHRVDDSTALADRWGGWYVTGRHGKQRHLGNVTYPDRPATAACSAIPAASSSTRQASTPSPPNSASGFGPGSGRCSPWPTPARAFTISRPTTGRRSARSSSPRSPTRSPTGPPPTDLSAS